MWHSRKHEEIWNEVKSQAAKRTKKRAKNIEVEVGSGNVFADLGLPDAEERLLKAELVFRIAQLINQKN